MLALNLRASHRIRLIELLGSGEFPISPVTFHCNWLSCVHKTFYNSAPAAVIKLELEESQSDSPRSAARSMHKKSGRALTKLLNKIDFYLT